MRRKSPLRRLAIVCYALALLSLEQAYALAPSFPPRLLPGENGQVRARAPASATRAVPRSDGIYLVYMGIAKGVPRGTLPVPFGSNVSPTAHLSRLAFAIRRDAVLRGREPDGLTAAHLVLALLVSTASRREKSRLFSSRILLTSSVLFSRAHVLSN